MTKKQTKAWSVPPQWVGVSGGISTTSSGALAWGRGSVPEIAKNRLDWAEKADFIIGFAVSLEQVHGTRVVEVTAANGGAGFLDPATRISATDGLFTRDPNVVLLTSHADCAPVFLYHPQARSIGLIHAGWRGTLAGIAASAVATQCRAHDLRPCDLLVAIGPTIGTVNYPVGEDVAAKFVAKFGPNVVTRYAGRPHLDVYAALIVDLLRAGVTDARNCPRPPDTFANPIWSSYRRDGERAGGMLAYFNLTSSMSE